MCYFEHVRVKKEYHLKRNDAIIAYKAFNVDSAGNLVSPVVGNKWPRFRCTWFVPTDAKFPRTSYSSSYKHGIYAMRSITGAKNATTGHVVAKVALWGSVLQYGAQRDRSYYYSRHYAGYKAEFAEILEVVSHSTSFGRYQYFFQQNLRRMRRRYARTKLIISI